MQEISRGLLDAIGIGLIVLVLALLIFSRMRKKQAYNSIKEMQRYYTYVKPERFRLSTNGGPNPCDNETAIERTDVIGYDTNMIVKQKVSI